MIDFCCNVRMKIKMFSMMNIFSTKVSDFQNKSCINTFLVLCAFI